MERQYRGPPECKTAGNTSTPDLQSAHRDTENPPISSTLAIEAPNPESVIVTGHAPTSTAKHCLTSPTDTSSSLHLRLIRLFRNTLALGLRAVCSSIAMLTNNSPSGPSQTVVTIPPRKDKEGGPQGMKVVPQLATTMNPVTTHLMDHPVTEPNSSTAQDSTPLLSSPSEAKNKHKARACAKSKTKENTTMKSENEIEDKPPVYPEGRWHPFNVDHLCTQTICMNANLPPNVRRWLNVKETTRVSRPTGSVAAAKWRKW